MKCFGWPTLIALVLLLAGCAPPSETTPPPHPGEPRADGQNTIQYGPAKDKVLWQYRTALAAMRQCQFDQAKPLLDDALARIEGVFGSDKSARQSRRYFSAEAKKTFIGEPYERVMAYYYRGILYWMDGELDNARACFRSGQIQDSDTAEKQYASDYALLDFLDGLATVKLGGDASDTFRRAQEFFPGKVLPPVSPNANVLFFVDYGLGPRKFASGQYGEQLRFQATESPVRSARLRIASQTLPLPPYDNLYFQATTRGGRVMDHVLGNKAVFKTTTGAVGDAAIISGAILAGATDRQEVGLGLLAAGLISKIVSHATTPEADVRTWDNLPLCLSFTALQLSPGQYETTVEFLDESNRVLQNLTKKIPLLISNVVGDQVIYVSDQSQIPQTL
jgi:hypothetical protein